MLIVYRSIACFPLCYFPLYRTALFLISILGSAFINTLDAQPNCAEHYFDTPIESITASAGTFSNLINRSGSVKYESERIFKRAKKEIEDLAKPQATCPADCELRPIPYLYFKSTPSRYHSEHRDLPHCKGLERISTRTPIRYSNNTLRSVQELTDWIGEVSQGKGKEGEDLYERCDRSCSPRFEYHITKFHPDDETYAVDAFIICGLPRDKSYNTYQLDAFFRWVCQPISQS